MAKATRGRPKTLDREHVLSVAVDAFWRDGVQTVSLNEICRRAEISKPGLYREFGHEDGLMKAALLAYQKNVLAQAYQMIEADRPFNETLDLLVSLVTRLDAPLESAGGEDMPCGCLLVKMRESYALLGNETQSAVDHARQEALVVYQSWVERSQEKGEYTADLSPELASVYIDAQLNNALSLMARGEPQSEVHQILTIAFSLFK